MSRRAGDAAGQRWLFLAAALPLFGLYLRTLSPTVPFEDGGEMIAPSFTLGIHHPPGYPLYALVGRLAAAVPLGDIAFRFNLLSAACGAAACGLAACVAYRLLAGVSGLRPALGWLASLAAAWLLGTASQLWWQSVIAEKYAMNLCFNAALLLVMAMGLAALRRAGRSPARWLMLLALLWGISASHHGQTVYFAPSAALLGWLALARLPARRRLRAAVFLVLLAVLGLSLKGMYPPIRSAAGPLFNWNAPSNLPRYADYAGGGPYQYRILYWTPWQAAKRLVHHVSDYPVRQFGYPGVALALLGLGWLFRVRRREALVLALAWGTGVLYCVNFSLEGIAVQTYYLPTFMILAVWIACGLAVSARWLESRGRLAADRRPAVSRPLTAAVAAALLIGWGGWQAAAHGRESRRDRHYFAWDLSSALLRSCPPGSILIAYADYDLFPLWYTHYIEERRPDVILVNSNSVPDPAATSTREGAKRVQLLFPRGQEPLARRFEYLPDLLRRDPGRPVCFSVVYEAAEALDLLPHGAVYRWCRDPEALRREDVRRERRWFHGWAALRGVLDTGAVRDSNTRTALSYYAYGDYRRAFVLDRRGEAEAALAMYRRALSWPDFWGTGPAATHASIGLLLYRTRHDVAGAIAEYEAAIVRDPSWLPAHRALGGLYVAEGRTADAVRVFRHVAELAPRDPLAQADLRRAEALGGRAR
ncbi:MAG: DUF2723 domain-containing protein [Candidatus Coatesbacteria bacterium]